MSKKLSIKVEFCGAMLEGVIVEKIAYVAMKPVVEGMGLHWGDQLERIKAHPVLGPELYGIRGIVAEDGKRREMMCLPESWLPFWMALINPNKVRPSILDKIITYQREAARVLHQAFSEGIADTNMRVMAIDSKRAAGRLMTDMKADVLHMIGKEANPYDFSNEHRLVNWALTGKFGPLEEKDLSDTQISLLAELRRRNAVLIGRGVKYDDRKKMLDQHSKDWHQNMIAKIAA
jgi:hypothetical protein